MNINKQIVAIDLDDTVWDFVGELLKRYNQKYNDNLTKEDITDWNIHKFLKPECTNIFKEFATEDFFDSLVIRRDIADALAIVDCYYDLYFVTACDAETIPWRAKALKKNLYWFKDDQLVKLKNKSLFVCDYLVDDNVENYLQAYSNSFLVKQPWNKHIQNSHDISFILYRISLMANNRDYY